jgi:uncharacterized membrane protein
MTTTETARLETFLGRILTWGTIVSTSLLATGLLLELAGVASAVGLGLTNAGIVILMATPLARVVASVGEYVRGRDWLFAALTGLVLVILLGSLVVAIK